MRALYIHISGLVGLLVFLKEVLNYAPIERTILVAATTGLTVYLMLVVGHTIVMRIMAYSPPPPRSESAPAANTAPGAAPASQAPFRPPDAEASPTPPPAAPAAPTTDEAADSQAVEDDTAEGDAVDAPNDAPEANSSAPDRAPNTDRQDADTPEPLAQTTA